MSDDDKKIGWMYEGTKAIVNREDYLLGKKIDKNFELYSDVFVKDKEEDRLKALEERSKSCNDDAGPSRVSHLQVDVVRSEDPLVALKMRQAQRQRELMDNPLNKVKFQRMMKEIFSDGKKKSKKHKKNKKKLRSSDSDSSEDERKKQKKRRNDLDEEKSPKRSERRRNDSRSPVRRARRGSPSLQPKSKRDDSGDRMRKRLKASPQRGDRRIEKRRGSSPECRRRRHDSDRSMDSDRRRDSYSIRSFQNRRESSRDRSRRNRSRSRSRSPRRRSRTSPRRHELDSRGSDRRRRSRTPENRRLDEKKPETGKSKMSEVDMEAKRCEMMLNAKWRDDLRTKNVMKAADEDQKELESDKGKVANFVKSFVNNATEAMSIEDKIKVKRKQCQSKPGYMNEL